MIIKDECPICEAKGMLADTVCRYCNGTGYEIYL